jgi:flagellar basal-body rod protein FlgF
MDKSLYVAMTGAAAAMRAQTTVANNLANASTVGFKAQLLGTETHQITAAGQPTRFNVVSADAGFDHSSGALQVTGGDLDVALADGVWLEVQDRAGNPAYTRAGELRINANGLLTTASGLLVNGDNGPVAIPPSEKLQLGADGTVSIVPQGQGPETLAQVGRLKLVQPEVGSLQRGGDGLFRVNGGPPPPAAGNVLTQGALEGSNVQIATTLVQMIELQRQFEMNVKVIKSTDDNSRASASLMRLS